LLAEKPLDLVDGNIGFALGVGIYRFDLVLAGNSASFIDKVNGDLRPNRTGNRASGREWAGQIVDNTNADRRGLGHGDPGTYAQCCSGRHRFFEERPPRPFHFRPPNTRQSSRSLTRDSNQGRCGVNVGLGRRARAVVELALPGAWVPQRRSNVLTVAVANERSTRRRPSLRGRSALGASWQDPRPQPIAQFGSPLARVEHLPIDAKQPRDVAASRI